MDNETTENEVDFADGAFPAIVRNAFRARTQHVRSAVATRCGFARNMLQVNAPSLPLFPQATGRAEGHEPSNILSL